MTLTATLVQRGPFNGTFSEAAGLYQLNQPYNYEGALFDHLVVSSIEADAFGPQDTLVLVADEYAQVYLGNDFPYQLEGGDPESHSHEKALAALGYELVPVEVSEASA